MVVRCSLFVVRCSLFVVRCSLFVVRCSLFVVRCSLFVVRCLMVVKKLVELRSHEERFQAVLNWELSNQNSKLAVLRTLNARQNWHF